MLRRNPSRFSFGHLVVSFAVKHAASFGFLDSAPLFEEKRDGAFFTKTLYPFYPFFFHRPCSRAAFTPNNYPIDSREFEISNIFQERLDGEESNYGPRFAQIFYTWNSMLFVFYADAPPHVRCLSGEAETR